MPAEHSIWVTCRFSFSQHSTMMSKKCINLHAPHIHSTPAAGSRDGIFAINMPCRDGDVNQHRLSAVKFRSERSTRAICAQQSRQHVTSHVTFAPATRSHHTRHRTPPPHPPPVGHSVRSNDAENALVRWGAPRSLPVVHVYSRRCCRFAMLDV